MLGIFHFTIQITWLFSAIEISCHNSVSLFLILSVRYFFTSQWIGDGAAAVLSCKIGELLSFIIAGRILTI